MKKINQFFLMALAVCSLTFVACDKDDDEVDEVNNATITMQFNGTTYNMGYYLGYYDKEGSWFKGYDRMIRLITSYDMVNEGATYSFVNPYLDLYGSYDKSAKAYVVDLDHSELYYDAAKSKAITDAIDDRDEDGDQIQYGDWTIYSVSNATIEFDADKLTFGATISATMFDEYGYQFDEEATERAQYATNDGALKGMTLRAANLKFSKVD